MKERTTNHPLIVKFKELGTLALHVYYEKSWYSLKRHIYPGHRHPSEKDIKEKDLVFDTKRHLFSDELIDQDIKDWEKASVKFILHLEIAKMSADQYEEYLKKQNYQE